MLAALLVVLANAAAGSTLCGQSDTPVLPRDTLPDNLMEQPLPLGFSEWPEAPADNPTTEKKVALGRQLFFDPILSTDGRVSCASCHQPDHGFASPDALAIGIDGRIGKRNAPTILNIGYAKSLSWDGRDESLEAQVLGPLTNPDELGGQLDQIIEKLRQSETYQAAFQAAFGPADTSRGPTEVVNSTNLAKAIAAFERRLVSGKNGADKFRNQQVAALSQEARSGMWIFESRGNCWKCHNGPNLSDEKFHNTGVSFGTADRDTGRMEATGDQKHKFQFKTPSLRNVQLTAPYMHDGSIKTLKEVVEFYNRGGSPNDPRLDQDIKPLNLTEQEVGFLVEFLKALTSSD